MITNDPYNSKTNKQRCARKAAKPSLDDLHFYELSGAKQRALSPKPEENDTQTGCRAQSGGRISSPMWISRPEVRRSPAQPNKKIMQEPSPAGLGWALELFFRPHSMLRVFRPEPEALMDG